MLVLAAAVLTVSLCAPWSRATEGLLIDTTRQHGFAWLGVAAVPAVVAAAVCLVLGVFAALGNPPPRPAMALAWVVLALGSVTALLVAAGSREVVVLQVGRPVEVTFGPSWREGPGVLIAGVTIAAAGLRLVRTSRRMALTRGDVALLVAVTLLMASTLAPWSWADRDRADAWDLYEWADTAIVITAALFAVLAVALKREAATFVCAAILALPFLDALGTGALGGFREPSDIVGAPVGVGAVLAGVGLAAAMLILLWPTPSAHAGFAPSSTPSAPDAASTPRGRS